MLLRRMEERLGRFPTTKRRRSMLVVVREVLWSTTLENDCAVPFPLSLRGDSRSGTSQRNRRSSDVKKQSRREQDRAEVSRKAWRSSARAGRRGVQAGVAKREARDVMKRKK